MTDGRPEYPALRARRDAQRKPQYKDTCNVLATTLAEMLMKHGIDFVKLKMTIAELTMLARAFQSAGKSRMASEMLSLARSAYEERYGNKLTSPL